MRVPRLLLDCDQDRAYVVSNEVIPGRKLLAADQEHFHGLLYPVAAFFGVEILDYTLTPVNFSITVYLPARRGLSDEQYQARHRALYGLWPSLDAPSVEAVAESFRQGGEAAAAIRRWMDARMGQLALFVKQLKQRVSAHGNRLREERGTFWTDRFKSTVAEGPALVWLSLLGAWSSVAQGFAPSAGTDPACAFGRAQGGEDLAREGICKLLEIPQWPQAQAAYQELLEGCGRSLGLMGESPGPCPGGLSPGRVAWLRIRYVLEATALGVVTCLALYIGLPQILRGRRPPGDWFELPPLPPELRMLRGRRTIF